MTETDGFYLTRSEQDQLRDHLAGVRQLCQDLAIVIAKLDRVGVQVRVRRIKKQSELDPLNFDALAARDDLHSTLVTWVRLVCEQRKLETPAIEATYQAAGWLRVHMIALAMTEGAGDALADIGNACKRAGRHVTPRCVPVEVDPARYEEACDTELNANGIECAARELGDEYRHLNADRVHNLARRNRITPVRWYGDIPVYRLGDVLAAHLSVPNRKRDTPPQILDTPSNLR